MKYDTETEDGDGNNEGHSTADPIGSGSGEEGTEEGTGAKYGDNQGSLSRRNGQCFIAVHIASIKLLDECIHGQDTVNGTIDKKNYG